MIGVHRLGCGACVALAAPALAAPPAAVDWGPAWSVTPEVSPLPYSEASGDNSETFRAVGVGASVTRRWGRWGLGGGAEVVIWRTEDFLDETDYHAALLAGLNGELLSIGGRVRTRLGGGLAVLLEGTENDEAGQMGFYADFRPIGFRWRFDALTLGLDPLTLLAAVPVAGGIPLVDVQYRFCLYVELGL